MTLARVYSVVLAILLFQWNRLICRVEHLIRSSFKAELTDMRKIVLVSWNQLISKVEHLMRCGRVKIKENQ